MSTLLCKVRPAAIVLAALAMASCSGEATEGPDPSETPSSPTSSDTSTPEAGACDEVIEAGVVAGLGWSSDTAPAEGLGGCSWEGPEGLISVASEAGSLDAACTELRRVKPRSGFEPTIELPSGERACAYVRDGEVGLSQLALEAEDGRVIGIRVAPITATSPDSVRVALLELAGTASNVS